MHIVIMGCGRVGSTLAHILEDQGYSVAIIDQDREAFRKLRSGFKGKRVVGVGFDQDVLIEAGIERADAFAAVSSGDNSNVIAARVVRESFGVERVAARIYISQIALPQCFLANSEDFTIFRIANDQRRPGRGLRPPHRRDARHNNSAQQHNGRRRLWTCPVSWKGERLGLEYLI